MDRSALLAKLQNLSPGAAALCSPAVTNADNAANWGPAIDNTLLLLGVGYADLSGSLALVPAGLEKDAIAISKMYGLELLCERLAADVSNNVSSGSSSSVTENKSNVLAQLRSQWNDQVNRVEGMGYQVERFTSGYAQYSIDIYEPDGGIW